MCVILSYFHMFHIELHANSPEGLTHVADIKTVVYSQT
jgi:hypothetical protein